MHIYPNGKLLPGWVFRVGEISPGHYQVDAISVRGMNVCLRGSDTAMLLRQAVDDACRLDVAGAT